MAFGTANRSDLSRVKEVTFGVTPTSPTMKLLRVTGEQLSDSLSFVKSQELRSDRQVSEIVLVDSNPGGTANFELSATSFDDLLESLMMSAWSTPLAIASVAADIVLDTSSPHLFSATAGKFSTIAVGQWIKLTGFGAGSGYYRVASNTGVAIDFDIAPTVANTPAGTTGSITGSYVRNGVTEQSYTLVERFLDLDTPSYKIMRGQRVSAASLSVKTGAIITGAFTFKGRSADITETEITGSTYTQPPATLPMNGVEDASSLKQNGLAFSDNPAILSLDVNIDNQHREQKGLFYLGNAGIAAGTFMTTLNLTQYFEDVVQAALYKASSGFAVALNLEDGLGNGYILTWPKIKYTEFNVNATALDTDLAVASKAEAYRDPLTNCMLQIDKFVAA